MDTLARDPQLPPNGGLSLPRSSTLANVGGALRRFPRSQERIGLGQHLPRDPQGLRGRMKELFHVPDNGRAARLPREVAV